MYLADVLLFFIKGRKAQVTLAFVTVGEIQTTTAETVGRSRNATVSTRVTYAISHVVKCKYMYNHA